MDGVLLPTLAGIVLFGKPLALRRLLPMVRIDYIRVPGNEWVEDPENRFQSIDIRKPLLMALPQAEASIIDELPRGFRLPEGQLQSVQEPILPRKVIREALTNAAMHRSYNCPQPHADHSLQQPHRGAQRGVTRSRHPSNWARRAHVCATPRLRRCCTTCIWPKQRAPVSAPCAAWLQKPASPPPNSIPTARPTSSSSPSSCTTCLPKTITPGCAALPAAS